MKKVISAVTALIMCLIPTLVFATNNANTAEPQPQQASFLSNTWPAIIIIIVLIGIYVYINSKTKKGKKDE